MTSVHHILNTGKQNNTNLVTKRHWDNRFKRYAIKLLPGDYFIAEGEEMIVTILGSCISACIRDRKLGLGGMNHFLLPEEKIKKFSKQHWAEDYDCPAGRYGDIAMELLINEILSLGGRKENLEAKIFGGGQVTCGKSNIGDNNISFAREYLSIEGIPVVSEDVGGKQARKLYYIPSTNEVLLKKIKMSNDTVAEQENRYLTDLKKSSICGDITFL